MNNKLLTLVLAVLAIGQAIYIATSGGGNSMVPEREYSGDVIAKVNGSPVKEEEIRERLDFITGGKGATIPLDKMTEKDLEALSKEVYVQKLVLDEALKQGINKESDLKNKVSSLVQTIYKEKFLEKIANKDITEDKIKKTYEDLVNKAKNSKQLKVKHILVKTEAEAKAAREKITGGAEFADVARLTSLDKGSAQKGGDLGYIFPEEFVPAFAEAVRKLSIGELSQPIKTEFGYHIVRVDDKKDAEIISFTEAEPRIKKQLGSDAVRAYIENLSKDLEIKVVKKPEPKAEEKKAVDAAKPADAKPAAGTPAAKPTEQK